MTQVNLIQKYRLNDPIFLGFFGLHVACLGVFFVPFSWGYVALAVALYFLKMFGTTAGFHRYFSHKTFKTSRAFQFILAVLGSLSLQNGVLWWAAHHRHHHKYSGQPEDIHSPEQRGFWWAHWGWTIFSREYDETRWDLIKDFSVYPELRWLNRHYVFVGASLGVLLSLFSWSAFFWGFIVSTVANYHLTFMINSLAHAWGSRRFVTNDDSRNNALFALATMGEGWHNNHHYYQNSCRQGMYWWEIDMTYMILKMLSWVGVVWDIKTHPARVFEDAQKAKLSAKLVEAPQSLDQAS